MLSINIVEPYIETKKDKLSTCLITHNNMISDPNQALHAATPIPGLCKKMKQNDIST